MTVREYLEENGFTLPVFLNHALQKMADPKIKTTHWWRELMMAAGYIDPKATTVINNAVSANASITNQNIQLTPEQEKEIKNEFSDFINAKYAGKPAMNPDIIGT